MDVFKLITLRRTIRKFEQRKVSSELLEKCVEAARVAPSGANLQPLKYVIVESEDVADKLFSYLKWAGYLAPNYNPKDDEKPTAYIVVCADTNIRKTGYEMDAGAAIENIILTALSENVGACWIASVDKEKTKELLGLSEGIEIVSVVALGYPKESPKEVEEKGDIKYYLENETLCVPKRKMEDVLIKTL